MAREKHTVSPDSYITFLWAILFSSLLDYFITSLLSSNSNTFSLSSLRSWPWLTQIPIYCYLALTIPTFPPTNIYVRILCFSSSNCESLNCCFWRPTLHLCTGSYSYPLFQKYCSNSYFFCLLHHHFFLPLSPVLLLHPLPASTLFLCSFLYQTVS